MIGGGVAGYRRNGAVAIAGAAGRAGFCDVPRALRVRDAGFQCHPLTSELWAAAAQAAGDRAWRPSRIVASEPPLTNVCPELELVDHHWAHASAAAGWTGARNAVVLVADSGGTGASVSLWRVAEAELTHLTSLPGHTGPAAALGRLAALAGFRSGMEEDRVEAIARLGRSRQAAPLVEPGTESWQFRPDAADRITAAASTGRLAPLAASLQDEIADRLAAVVQPYAAPGLLLVATGGIFFNTAISTGLHEKCGFDAMTVPVNPGNAGLAPSLAFLATDMPFAPLAGDAFLGPEFSDHEIKAVLDNCKLRYDHIPARAVEQRVVDTLARGGLVGWFQGAMEAGPRALGHRSILADPYGRYVLDNLNKYLKQREAYRPFALAVREEDVERWFVGPPRSRAMEYEYELRPDTGLEHFVPKGVTRIRLQTLPDDDAPLRRIVAGLGQHHPGKLPAVVNTSLNGFHEPLAASPRDALRIFFGTALDVLAIGGFLLEK